MSPKLVFTAFLIVCVSFCQAQQEYTNLSGDVTVRLKKKALSANYIFTNITIDNPKMSFILHEDLDVEQVYLNGNPIASSKNGRFCKDCKVHTIWIDRPLAPQDTLSISVEGNMENLTEERFQLSVGADEKWYPIILNTSARLQGVSFASRKYDYTYALNIKCGDCKTVLLNDAVASDNTLYRSEVPSDNIQLILSTKELEYGDSAQSSRAIEAKITKL